MKTGPSNHDLSGSLPRSPEVLEKHKRYGSRYGKNETYWGLGIECESYLEISNPTFVSSNFFLKQHARERYSVDYYTSYKADLFQTAVNSFQAVREDIPLPILVNAHAICKTDALFEHKTLYTKDTPPNPKFSGKTIFEICQERCPSYFKDQYDVSFTFDGDSIEIMTQDFYKTTVEKVMQEFLSSRTQFLEALRSVWNQTPELRRWGDIKWTSGNHGFAVMATNPKNLAIFNNGTYHINITLPTELDDSGAIRNPEKFRSNHKQFIQYVQWLEPILVANFGSPDPMCWLQPNLYAVGSQRAAMSRYIGLGTYDTTQMPTGKILTMNAGKVRSSWYKEYHKTSGYTPLSTIGLDINYHKHFHHGVELRFFDWFPEKRLWGLLKFLVFLGDLAMERICPKDPLESEIWNRWMVRVIQKGQDAGCTKDEAAQLSLILGFPCMECKTLDLLFADLFCILCKKYKDTGICAKSFFSTKQSCMECGESRIVQEVDVGCCCLPNQKKKDLRGGGGVGGGGRGAGGKGT